MKYVALAAILTLVSLPAPPADFSGSFDVSYTAGARDAAGRFMGGTEIRDLVARGGKLLAANGYWKDTLGLTGTPGPQILVLDARELCHRRLRRHGEARASAGGR